MRWNKEKSLLVTPWMGKQVQALDPRGCELRAVGE